MDYINKKKILIVGGTGFIGHNLLKKFVDNNFTTFSLSKNPPNDLRKVKDVEYIFHDITKKKFFKKKIFYDFDYIINSSGYIDHSNFDENGFQNINVHYFGLLNLIDSIKKDKLIKFIHLGSSDEYGDSPSPQSEEMKEDPISPYSAAKIASTYYLKMMHRTQHFPAVILRLFLIYGPNQSKDRFIPQLINSCIKNKEIKTTFGDQIRDFCHINDISEAIYKLLNVNNINGEIFNLASGQQIKVIEVIKIIQKITNAKNISIGARQYRNNENMSLFANIEKIKKTINWSSQISIYEGLNNLINNVS